jgi:ATP-dependent DNA ligase
LDSRNQTRWHAHHGPPRRLWGAINHPPWQRFYVPLSIRCHLPARSFLIDGEAIVTNGDGLAVFDLMRHKRHGDSAVLCAFDLIELDGEDLRRSSIEYRKRKLVKLVTRGAHLGSCLMSITRAMAKSSLSTPVSSAARASCRSGSAP